MVRRRRHLLRLQLAVAEHHRPARLVAGVQMTPRSFRPLTASSAGAITLARSTSRSRASSCTTPTPTTTAVQNEAFIDGTARWHDRRLRSKTAGRDASADACHRRQPTAIAFSTLTVIGYNDRRSPDAQCRRHRAGRADRRGDQARRGQDAHRPAEELRATILMDFDRPRRRPARRRRHERGIDPPAGAAGAAAARHPGAVDRQLERAEHPVALQELDLPSLVLQLREIGPRLTSAARFHFRTSFNA